MRPAARATSCRPSIPAAVTDEAMRLAERAHAALGCRGVTRTDFRYDDTGTKPRLIALEVNTQPGMTLDLAGARAGQASRHELRQPGALDHGGRLMRQVKARRSPRTAAVRSSGRVKTVRERSAPSRSSASRRKSAKEAPKSLLARVFNAALRRCAIPC